MEHFDGEEVYGVPGLFYDPWYYDGPEPEPTVYLDEEELMDEPKPDTAPWAGVHNIHEWCVEMHKRKDDLSRPCLVKEGETCHGWMKCPNEYYAREENLTYTGCM